MNRFGGGLAQTIAGPNVALLDDVRRLTAGNIMEAASGEDTNAGAELIRFAQDYTPGSSIWYARLGLERLVWDRLQIMTDPKAKQKMRKRERKYKKDYGQKYWWAPGDARPTRSPNLDNALGN